MINWKPNTSIENLLEVAPQLSEQELTSLPTSDRHNITKYASYPIWACDDEGYCLVGESADEIEHINEIIDYYNNQEAFNERL